MTNDDLVGKTIRVRDATGASVVVEGRCVAVSDGPVVFVETVCGCGARLVVAHLASLPIEVQEWVQR